MSVGTTASRASYGFPRSMRIIKSSDFAAVLTAKGRDVFRLKSGYFSATCLKRPSEGGSLRFGITVGKKFAPHATARVVVKRALRETARHQAPYLIALLCETGVGLDVSLRLIKSIESFRAPYSGAHRDFRSAMRRDLLSLFAQITEHLEQMRQAEAKE